MKQSIKMAGIDRSRTRREALGLLGAGAILCGVGTARAEEEEKVLTEALVLRELHEGVTPDEVKAKTGCAFQVSLES